MITIFGLVLMIVGLVLPNGLDPLCGFVVIVGLIIATIGESMRKGEAYYGNT